MSKLYSSSLNPDAVYYGRTIPKESFDKAIKEYMNKNHKPVYLNPNKRNDELDNIVGLVKNIDIETYNIDIELTDNPSGILIKKLIEENHNIAVSCRFIGEKINEKDEYENVRLEDIVVLSK